MSVLCVLLMAGGAMAGDKEVKLACVVGDGTKSVTENAEVTRVGDVHAEASWLGNVSDAAQFVAECNEKYSTDCNGACWACRDYDEKILGMTNMGCYDQSGNCRGWCPPF